MDSRCWITGNFDPWRSFLHPDGAHITMNAAHIAHDPSIEVEPQGWMARKFELLREHLEKQTGKDSSFVDSLVSSLKGGTEAERSFLDRIKAASTANNRLYMVELLAAAAKAARALESNGADTLTILNQLLTKNGRSGSVHENLVAAMAVEAIFGDENCIPVRRLTECLDSSIERIQCLGFNDSFMNDLRACALVVLTT